MRKNYLIELLHNEKKTAIREPEEVFQTEEVAQRWKPESESSLTSHLDRDITELRGFRAESGKLYSCSQLSLVLTVLLSLWVFIPLAKQSVSVSYLSQLNIFLRIMLC